MTVKELMKALAALPGDAPVKMRISEDIGCIGAFAESDVGVIAVERDDQGNVARVIMCEDESVRPS